MNQQQKTQQEPQLAFSVKIPQSLWLAVEHRLVDTRTSKRDLVMRFLKEYLEEATLEEPEAEAVAHGRGRDQKDRALRGLFQQLKALDTSPTKSHRLILEIQDRFPELKEVSN